MTYYYVTFPSTHDALSFESTFKGQFIFRIVPVPREISASCGIAARVPEDDYSQLMLALKDPSITYGEIHKLTKNKAF